jgi:Domain of unknown function (DUF4124)
VKLALAAALLALALPAQAQMYKCIDATGATRYSDRPAPGCKAVDIRPSPPLSGEVKARDQDFAVQEAELKRRLLEREGAEAKAREAREMEEQRCASLRREETILASGVPVRRYNDKGEAVFMDDAVRDTRRGELAQALRGCR